MRGWSNSPFEFLTNKFGRLLGKRSTLEEHRLMQSTSDRALQGRCHQISEKKGYCLSGNARGELAGR